MLNYEHERLVLGLDRECHLDALVLENENLKWMLLIQVDMETDMHERLLQLE